VFIVATGCIDKHVPVSVENRTGQDMTGQDRTGQDRTGQDRTGQDRTGQDSVLEFLNPCRQMLPIFSSIVQLLLNFDSKYTPFGPLQLLHDRSFDKRPLNWCMTPDLGLNPVTPSQGLALCDPLPPRGPRPQNPGHRFPINSVASYFLELFLSLSLSDWGTIKSRI
jgi:hypothetical protein